MIEWVGHSAILKKPLPMEGETKYVFALTEEAIADVVFGDWGEKKHLTKKAAFQCMNRHRFRKCLEDFGHQDLNPAWSGVLLHRARVIKTPFSSMGVGVHVVGKNFYSKLWQELFKELGDRYWGVVEDLVEGDFYQIQGAVVDDSSFFLAPSLQKWCGGAVVEYQSVADEELVFEMEKIAAKVIEATGLDNSCFCLELCHSPEVGWKVIEMNARLGEDVGLECSAEAVQWHVGNFLRRK